MHAVEKHKEWSYNKQYLEAPLTRQKRRDYKSCIHKQMLGQKVGRINSETNKNKKTGRRKAAGRRKYIGRRDLTACAQAKTKAKAKAEEETGFQVLIRGLDYGFY
jgi:hypothetical protein